MNQATHNKNIEVSFGGYSVAGAKASNEDAFSALQPSEGARHYKGAAACIADGVSCSDNAALASQTSVTQFIEDYYSTPDSWLVKKAAARVLTALNSWLYHYGKQSGMPHTSLVTTFTGIICKSTTAHIVHVGDSRIYRFRDNRLTQLTNDHCHSQVGKKVFLTRALGMDSRLEVDYLQENLQLDDIFLLTTDGVHGFSPLRTLEKQLQNVNNDLKVSAKNIVEQAIESGSDDNVSCLLVRIDKLPAAEIDEVHRELTRLAIPPVLEPGVTIDQYEVIKTVYSSTRSHLYLVKEKNTDNQYLLKAPSEQFAEDPQYLEGFIREQWIGQTIDNPRVMKIHPRPEDTKFLYHLCEYIKGQSLRQWMYDHPQPDIESVRDILKEIVSGVRAFQRMDMVHRDLKPENILIDEHGQVKIIDFGTVKASGLEEIQSPLSEEVPMGSVDYIAPEYQLGQGASSISDLFSLAVIAYECLCGKLPFSDNKNWRTRKSYGDWQYNSITKFRKDIPRWLDMALQQACDPNPQKRYQAFSEYIKDICVPNQQKLLKHEKSPLIERHPVLFWKVTSAILIVTTLLQAWYIANT